MKLNNIGIILADTSRSLIYLNSLIDNQLIPSFAIVILNQDKDIISGQNKNDKGTELLKILEKSQVNYDITNKVNINDNIDLIKQRNENIFIYSGFGGQILGDEILNLGKKFLHIHGGYLPHYKGSTSNYYSLIDHGYIGASAIFLEKEIDSGPILFRQKIRPYGNLVEIDHVYDSEIRARVLVNCIKEYIKNKNWVELSIDNSKGETFYVIHPVLKHLAILTSY